MTPMHLGCSVFIVLSSVPCSMFLYPTCSCFVLGNSDVHISKKAFSVKILIHTLLVSTKYNLYTCIEKQQSKGTVQVAF